MKNNIKKKWFRSKTLQGLAVVALPIVLNALGVDINTLFDQLDKIVQTAGLLIAAYSRWRAKGELTL